MAIMILKERGTLDFDDSVRKYIPEFPYKGITIRHLLTHRSGLPNYAYFSDKFWPNHKNPLSNEDLLSMLIVHRPAVYFRPDKRFDYSNTGYSVLATIVSRVSGMPFSVFLQRYIFHPLQMTHTFTYGQEAGDPSYKVATGYISGRRKRSPDYMDTVLGDKGVFSTVEDLHKWDQALYTQKLVSRQTLEQAFSGSGMKLKKAEDYGFGWRIRQVENGDTVLYHGGLWHGFNTYLLRNPKDHSAIIVLSNHTNGSLLHIKELRNFLYPGQKNTLAKASKKIRKTARAQL
jgi:CubicO group peptidase (beta-lactamase class C family)